ncbi:hypothetical protein MJ561_19620 [Klebsiella pneumoniae]|nr:hypothetical protein MJ561_19620 [Klebsiella pneumoniae]
MHTDEESGQTIGLCMGELHLEIIVDRMKREFGVGANIGPSAGHLPRNLRKKVTDVGRQFAGGQSGGKGQYGQCRVDPRSRWSRQRFRSRTPPKAAWCRASTSLPWRKGLRERWAPACWRVIRWLT